MASTDWAKTTLDNVLPIKYGKARSQENGTPRSNVAVYGSSGIIDRFNRSLTSRASLIIGRKGSVGEVYFSKDPCWPIDTTYYVEESQNIYLPFFYYRLRFFGLSHLDRSTAVPGLSRDDYNALTVSLPSLNEQKEIVKNIEEIFSDLDNAIETLKKTQEQLKIYRRAILKYVFSGKWKKVPLEKISNAVGGFAFKSSDFKDSGNYQVIRIGNVRPGLIRPNVAPIFLTNVEKKILDRYLLKPRDVVISLTGTRKKRDYGFTAIIKDANLLLNQRLAYLRFGAECEPGYFLYYSWTESFKDSFFASETGNVGQGNVGMKAIQSTAIPLPPVKEQLEIIQAIESKFSVCDELQRSLEINLHKANSLRHGILKQAFEGKLTERWRNEHEALISGENSAAALLKKIIAEKSVLNGKAKRMKNHD